MQSTKDKSLFAKFFPTPKFLTIPAVGIDISDNSIHLIEFADKHGRKTLKKFGKYPIPDGVIIKGEIKKIKELTDILKKIKKDNNINFVRASLPEEKAYLFQTQIPGDVTDENIRSILEFKLEEYVPLSPSSAIFDYNILPNQKDSDLLNVVVAVYPKNTIEKYTVVFEDAGMTLLSLEIEAQAIKRTVVKEGDTGTYMIVDFGKTKTGLSIVSNNVLSFTSTLEVEEERLTNTIVKHLKVSEAEADRVKNEEGLIKTRNNKELFRELMNTAESFKDDINKHYRYWQTRVDEKGNRVDAIEKIIICGGNSNLAGLPEFLSSSLKVKVERANVWANVFLFNDFVPEIDSFNSLSYATAIGLALRNIT
ncbi:pilus assembly protein PilM [bacterium]|jgi:type IV pilus assembly protein PilM|nr:pilus assembly protein PilM [bacterium]MBT3729809.1 pilus assembly protein PilM [bacterium]MBT4894722.1 pilus assembly protein PilM [bacterium]